mmetsp:Transcript_2433/g.4548  ORF Transcript_2433/g.4548 Transcript_2433/m.4548 type:complete len:154 (-) Transcript_2433:813-1274(-)
MCGDIGAVQCTNCPLVESNASLGMVAKYVVGALFIFRESYVQLITSQHRSFISSVLTPNQSSKWFAPISGLTSVTNAFLAMGVGKLSAVWGLHGVLAVAAIVLGGSVVFGEMAYSIADNDSQIMIAPILFGCKGTTLFINMSFAQSHSCISSL